MDNGGHWLETLAETYASPLVRTIIQIPLALDPSGLASASDAALMSAIESMRRKRHRAFYDELAMGAHLLSADLIQSEDFLHDYLCSLRAAVNTRRQEKVRLCARLLLGAIRTGQLGSDKFEEFLAILDDLSLREFSILLILKQFLKDSPAKTLDRPDGHSVFENDLQRVNRFWPGFEQAVSEQLLMDAAELRAVLNRLTRTGLYESLAGIYFDYVPGRGLLTPLFDEFAAWLQVSHENLATDQGLAAD